jgi:hypothetical protein
MSASLADFGNVTPVVGRGTSYGATVVHVSSPNSRLYVQSSDWRTYDIVRLADGMPLRTVLGSDSTGTAASAIADAMDAAGEIG